MWHRYPLRYVSILPQNPRIIIKDYINNSFHVPVSHISPLEKQMTCRITNGKIQSLFKIFNNALFLQKHRHSICGRNIMDTYDLFNEDKTPYLNGTPQICHKKEFKNEPKLKRHGSLFILKKTKSPVTQTRGRINTSLL